MSQLFYRFGKNIIVKHMPDDTEENFTALDLNTDKDAFYPKDTSVRTYEQREFYLQDVCESIKEEDLIIQIDNISFIDNPFKITKINYNIKLLGRYLFTHLICENDKGIQF